MDQYNGEEVPNNNLNPTNVTNDVPENDKTNDTFGDNNNYDSNVTDNNNNKSNTSTHYNLHKPKKVLKKTRKASNQTSRQQSVKTPAYKYEAPKYKNKPVSQINSHDINSNKRITSNQFRETLERMEKCVQNSECKTIRLREMINQNNLSHCTHVPLLISNQSKYFVEKKSPVHERLYDEVHKSKGIKPLDQKVFPFKPTIYSTPKNYEPFYNRIDQKTTHPMRTAQSINTEQSKYSYQPSINKCERKLNSDIFDHLYQLSKQKRNKKVKSQSVNKTYTFHPKIDPNSVEILKTRSNSTSSAKSLMASPRISSALSTSSQHKKALSVNEFNKFISRNTHKSVTNDQMTSFEEKELRELKHCTFAPNTKSSKRTLRLVRRSQTRN